MPTRELYLLNVRNPITRKWRQTRYRLTAENARERYGEGNYERIDASREVRDGDPARSSAAHLARNANGG